MDRSLTYLSHSPEETLEFARKFGRELPEGAVLCFFGGLGAGKTTFIKGLAAGVAEYPEEHVSSPTFVILNIYEGKRVVYHFDLYRLQNEEQFLSLGFDQFLGQQGVACIEWAEKIQGLIPPEAYKITFTTLSEQDRSIEIRSWKDG